MGRARDARFKHVHIKADITDLKSTEPAWTVASYATARDFSTLTSPPTTTELANLLETLVEELQTMGLIN